jgi:hypothetical protein
MGRVHRNAHDRLACRARKRPASRESTSARWRGRNEPRRVRPPRTVRTSSVDNCHVRRLKFSVRTRWHVVVVPALWRPGVRGIFELRLFEIGFHIFRRNDLPPRRSAFGVSPQVLPRSGPCVKSDKHSVRWLNTPQPAQACSSGGWLGETPIERADFRELARDADDAVRYCV